METRGPRCFMSLAINSQVSLAPYTTLRLGGPARFFAEATDEAAVREALAWAEQRSIPTFVLGAGSNLIVPDTGYDGLVVRIATRGLTFTADDEGMICEAAAGEPWDDVVAASVARDLGGLECLSGIPGTTGATPVQNVGAYGQEVADTITSVRVLERANNQVRDFAPGDCAFAYRDSVFKRDPGKFVVTSVRFRLIAGAAPTLRYAELQTALAATPTPTLADTRAAVIALRRRKSMVLDDADPNRRSVGSFFTNPILATDAFDELCARVVGLGLAKSSADIPRYPAGPGQIKMPAAWLIERAGFHKGLRRGPVGLSSAHTLALVHHGSGTTDALLALAREIRDGVATRFGVRLSPEPVILGATDPADPLRLA
ncbi:MAG TPA: UDP-N-acetylmuramate dehydrogenase [Polyangia bacterium]